MRILARMGNSSRLIITLTLVFLSGCTVEGKKKESIEYFLVRRQQFTAILRDNLTLLARVVRKVDNAIHRINHYPVDSGVCFVNTYPLNSDLSGG